MNVGVGCTVMASAIFSIFCYTLFDYVYIFMGANKQRNHFVTFFVGLNIIPPHIYT